jgi:hypothetical protein
VDHHDTSGKTLKFFDRLSSSLTRVSLASYSGQSCFKLSHIVLATELMLDPSEHLFVGGLAADPTERKPNHYAEMLHVAWANPCRS